MIRPEYHRWLGRFVWDSSAHLNQALGEIIGHVVHEHGYEARKIVALEPAFHVFEDANTHDGRMPERGALVKENTSIVAGSIAAKQRREQRMSSSLGDRSPLHRPIPFSPSVFSVRLS